MEIAKKLMFPMTISDVVRETNIPRSLVQKAVDKGELPSFEVGGRVRIDRRSLDKYIEERFRKARVIDCSSEAAAILVAS